MRIAHRLAPLLSFCIASAISSPAAGMPFQPIPPSAQSIYAPIAGLEEFASWQLAVAVAQPGELKSYTGSVEAALKATGKWERNVGEISHQRLEELRREGKIAPELYRAVGGQATTEGGDPEGVRGRAGGAASGLGETPASELRSPVLTETPQASRTPAGAVSSEIFRDQVKEAKARSQRENVARNQAKVIDTGGRKAVVLDADALGAWHRTFGEEGNFAGAGTAWRGMTLPRAAANRAIVMLKGWAGTSRLEPGGKDVAAGYDRLAQAIQDARDKTGAVTVLRGDYREDIRQALPRSTTRVRPAFNWLIQTPGSRLRSISGRLIGFLAV